ncbi:unnamed protein product [Tilletia controversa]|uniref:Uncharacterized protein n=2 Tax=Tilletia TaxID=13289 RepID=A0A9N8QQX5_9BASI|nr:unnamed protein product [Tilletia controversa]CAD6915740.1 unnamed protein product [Tilletia caries]CAD6950067.1 unnamed protein product [Tilletia laevis]CAD6939556.1 unnamed protein product [Tilletia controversa]CAD6944808.1 unnamed protein product [Tilletia controversa]
MPVPASSSGSRKRPASPSLPAGDSNTSSQQNASSGQATVKRQRVGGRSGRPASSEVPAQAATPPSHTGQNLQVQPVASVLSNLPQQTLQETVEAKASRRVDKGKGREVPKDSAQGSSRQVPTAASPLPTRNGTSARPDPATALGGDDSAATSSALSSPVTAPGPSSNEDPQNTTVVTEDAVPTMLTQPGERNENGTESLQLTSLPDHTGQESRETLQAQLQILRRRLEASERIAESQARVLVGLHERCSCDVCFDLMTRPCVIAPCGHMACRECLVAYWKQPSVAEPPIREGLTEDERQRMERHRTLARVKICPICRSECLRAPAEVWLMKQIVGDVERWRSVEDRDATRETIRRSLETEREQERLRQERTNREAGPSTLTARRPATPQEEGRASPVPAPTVPATHRIAAQLQERAARLKEAEAVRKETAATSSTVSVPKKSGDDSASSTTTAPRKTSHGDDELNLFPSDDEREAAKERDGPLAVSGSQASQAAIVESARAQREAGMQEEVWAERANLSPPIYEDPWTDEAEDVDPADEDHEEDFWEFENPFYEGDGIDEEEEEEDDLSDFIVPDGLSDIDAGGDGLDEDGQLTGAEAMGYDSQEDDDEDEEDAYLSNQGRALRALFALRMARSRSAAYGQSTSEEEEDDDDDETGTIIQAPPRLLYDALTEDEDDDGDGDAGGSGSYVRNVDRARQAMNAGRAPNYFQNPVVQQGLADQHTFEDENEDEDFDGQQGVEYEDSVGEEEDEHLYPAYYPPDPEPCGSELTPEPENEFHGQNPAYDSGLGYEDESIAGQSDDVDDDDDYDVPIYATVARSRGHVLPDDSEDDSKHALDGPEHHACSELLAARAAAYADGGVDGGLEFDRINDIDPGTLFSNQGPSNSAHTHAYDNESHDDEGYGDTGDDDHDDYDHDDDDDDHDDGHHYSHQTEDPYGDEEDEDEEIVPGASQHAEAERQGGAMYEEDEYGGEQSSDQQDDYRY